ncbi:rhodanese-like domain-containing protein [Candidatus Absconditicoccus praedator]|uniref:rhodanese-like domain-containing protein n=1 Tax=Candidatus Absconditicoccus praedator TaxID=2735562 RepID=UPI001E3C1C28|nr:rhodanese-like domain-containing protein [Candidatus Absconditicoccus praedator]UFX83107.1 rhodanese-like domain-containing protein [Candidatus Absconditicoccus praedator]
MQKLFIIITTISFSFLTGCIQQNTTNYKNNFNSISTEEFVNLKQSGKYQIIDIRNKHELQNTGHIPKAKKIEYYSKEFLEILKNLDKDKKYLIYCNTGNRTSHTLDIMENMGFEKAFHLKGGIQEWMKEENDLINCSTSYIC